MSAPVRPRRVVPQAKAAEATKRLSDPGPGSAAKPRRAPRRRVDEVAARAEVPRPGLPPALEVLHANVALSEANEDRPALWRALPNIGFAPLLWKEGLECVKAGASALVAQGLAPGARVAIAADGDWPVALVAALAAGGEAALCPAGDLEYLQRIARSRAASLVVAPAATISAVVKGRQPRSGPRWIASESLLDGARWIGRTADFVQPSPKAFWLPAREEVRHSPRKPGLCGISLTHGAIFDLCQKFLRLFALTPADHVLCLLPVTEPAMISAGFLAPLMAGATLHLDPGAPFDSRQLTVFRPTVLIATQAQWQLLGERIEAQLSAAGTRGRWARRVALKRHALEVAMRPVPPSTDAKYRLGQQLAIAPLKRLFGLGRVRLAIAVDAQGPLDSRLVEAFAAIDLPLHAIVGTAATAGLAFVNAPSSARFDALGRPFPGLQARLDDAGALWLKGPTLAAEAVDREGWLRALDRAEIDFEGFVRTAADQGG